MLYMFTVHFQCSVFLVSRRSVGVVPDTVNYQTISGEVPTRSFLHRDWRPSRSSTIPSLVSPRGKCSWRAKMFWLWQINCILCWHCIDIGMSCRYVLCTCSNPRYPALVQPHISPLPWDDPTHGGDYDTQVRTQSRHRHCHLPPLRWQSQPPPSQEVEESWPLVCSSDSTGTIFLISDSPQDTIITSLLPEVGQQENLAFCSVFLCDPVLLLVSLTWTLSSPSSPSSLSCPFLPSLSCSCSVPSYSPPVFAGDDCSARWGPRTD